MRRSNSCHFYRKVNEPYWEHQTQLLDLLMWFRSMCFADNRHCLGRLDDRSRSAGKQVIHGDLAVFRRERNSRQRGRGQGGFGRGAKRFRLHPHDIAGG